MDDYNIVIPEFKAGIEVELVIPKKVINDNLDVLPNNKKFYIVSYMDKENRPYEQHIYLIGNNGHTYISDPIEWLHIKLMEDRENKKSRRLLKFLTGNSEKK